MKQCSGRKPTLNSKIVQLLFYLCTGILPTHVRLPKLSLRKAWPFAPLRQRGSAVKSRLLTMSAGRLSASSYDLAQLNNKIHPAADRLSSQPVGGGGGGGSMGGNRPAAISSAAFVISRSVPAVAATRDDDDYEDVAVRRTDICNNRPGRSELAAYSQGLEQPQHAVQFTSAARRTGIVLATTALPHSNSTDSTDDSSSSSGNVDGYELISNGEHYPPPDQPRRYQKQPCRHPHPRPHFENHVYDKMQLQQPQSLDAVHDGGERPTPMPRSSRLARNRRRRCPPPLPGQPSLLSTRGESSLSIDAEVYLKSTVDIAVDCSPMFSLPCIMAAAPSSATTTSLLIADDCVHRSCNAEQQEYASLDWDTQMGAAVEAPMTEMRAGKLYKIEIDFHKFAIYIMTILNSSCNIEDSVE